MSKKTIFKKIIDREVPAEIVYEDDLCMAFRDINPQSPVHILVIPKKEIASVNDVTESDKPLVGHLFTVTATIAAQLGLQSGYRVVVNCGPDAGQTVMHLHLHLLAGRRLSWPPG
jgi:histidine triad (HIT) family protein